MSQTRHPREELEGIIAEDKPTYVKNMFDSIAENYDRMNWIMTGGLLAFWHRSFISTTGLSAGQRALDVCCGTGDLSFLQSRRVASGGEVIGLDFSPNMLEIAKLRDQQLQNRGGAPMAPIRWIQGDAMNLPFEDGDDTSGFDAVTMGFALRNVADVPKAISEMARVLKVGGRMVCLEVSRPDNSLLRTGFNVYFFKLVPLIGRMAERRVPKDSTLAKLRPYTYLPYSLEHLPEPSKILEVMRQSGLTNVRRIPLTGGIVSLYVGDKA